MISRLTRGLAALLLATPLASALPAQSAQAACQDMGTYYSITSSSAIRIPFSNIPTFKNGPGGTLSVTKDYSGSASYQVTLGAESEVGVVLARAKVSVSASLTLTNSSSVSNNYSHTITNGKYGHAQYVSWGQKVNWKKYYISATCTTTTKATGTIKFPSTSEGWYYWETTS